MAEIIPTEHDTAGLVAHLIALGVTDCPGVHDETSRCAECGAQV
jgi:hypothetical protein